MKLSRTSKYLTLNYSSSATQRRVDLNDHMADVLKNWTAGTRVSPIWKLGEGKGEIPSNGTLVFLGPIKIASLYTGINFNDLETLSSLWCSLGLFNLIISFQAGKTLGHDVKAITDWAKKNATPYEVWEIKDSIVSDITDIHGLNICCKPSLLELASLMQNKKAKELGCLTSAPMAQI